MNLLSEESLEMHFGWCGIGKNHQLRTHIAAQAAEIEALKHYKQKYTDGLRALSESEAAVRVLSEAIEESQRFLQSAAAGAFEESEGDCIEHELVRVEDVIASLPSSAAANAESHRRMREYIAKSLEDYYSYGSVVIIPCLECGEIEEWQFKREHHEYHCVSEWVIAAQDALNPDLPSAGKLHQELQGEQCP